MPGNSGAGNGSENLMGAWKNCVLSEQNAVTGNNSPQGVSRIFCDYSYMIQWFRIKNVVISKSIVCINSRRVWKRFSMGTLLGGTPQIIPAISGAFLPLNFGWGAAQKTQGVAGLRVAKGAIAGKKKESFMQKNARLFFWGGGEVPILFLCARGFF